MVETSYLITLRKAIIVLLKFLTALSILLKNNIEIKDGCKLIRVRKVPFRFFDKLKNEIQNPILRFCFYFNKEDDIQITDCHFRV